MNYHIRRHRVEIQKKVERRNTVGEVLYGFERVCEIWAEIKDGLISVRYVADVYPGDRVVIGESRFKIIGVIDRRGKTRLTELQVEQSGTRDDAACARRMNSSAKGFPQSGANASIKEKDDASVGC